MNELRICPLARPENFTDTKSVVAAPNVYLVANRNAKVKKVLTFIDSCDSMAFHDTMIDLIVMGEATEEMWMNLAAQAKTHPLKTSRGEIRRRLLDRIAKES